MFHFDLSMFPFFWPCWSLTQCYVWIKWTPTGRRLITGSQSGEFTLWNGQSFNFEMILQVVPHQLAGRLTNMSVNLTYFLEELDKQAHDQAVRSMVWSNNENWMVTGDDGGAIKYVGPFSLPLLDTGP